MPLLCKMITDGGRMEVALSLLTYQLPLPGDIAMRRVCWCVCSLTMCWSWVSLKLLEIETRFQWTTYRKWHMGNRMITWRDQVQGHDPDVWSLIGYNGAPIGNCIWRIEWSHDWWRAAGQSGRNDVTTDFPAPFENISVSAFFLIALQWTWQ